MSEHPILDRIDRYLITSKLGEGGMGVVYAARDERLDRPVAIKMIRKAMADERSRERLWREARAAAKVNHPNICQLYEIGEARGELFIAMELLEGESLASRIARGPLPVSAATEIMLAMLSALDALHRRGLIHRDLKPSNVFLTPVGPKLLDFGLARAVDRTDDAGETGLTLPGAIVGTPQYLAPEQLRGEPVDARSDLFAAGAILFEMLTGKPPFNGPNTMQVLHAVMYERPPVLGGAPGIAAIDRIVHRALAKKPEQRYQTANRMADDVRAAMLMSESGELIAPRPMTRLIVLPFRILRSDPETDFLAFSLPDAITCSLSGLESLVVRSSVTASRFGADAADLEAIAHKAEVDAVVAGTILRAGDQMRVSTQLVEAPAGTVIWSQASQVPLGDVFQLQDDLTRRIVESLSVPITARDRRVLKHDVPASAKAYEFYLRANQLAYESKSWTVARDLYLKCLEEDPQFAPAWARVGRIYRVIGIYTADAPDVNYEKAQAAFDRALQLNPDLSLAHNLYTNLEVELGRAQAAMLRLLERARHGAGDAELFAGLVQACRYCGLLDASVAAYEHAHRLDPEIRTSVNNAYFALGNYQRAIETDIEDPPFISVLALILMKREGEALELLREQEARPLPEVPHLFTVAQRALLEGQRTESLNAMKEILAVWRFRDPCARYYIARHLAYLGDAPTALEALAASVDGGFYCYPLLARDPWLDGLRTIQEFKAILRRAESRQRDAIAAFIQAGGDQVLGRGAPPVEG